MGAVRPPTKLKEVITKERVGAADEGRSRRSSARRKPALRGSVSGDDLGERARRATTEVQPQKPKAPRRLGDIPAGNCSLSEILLPRSHEPENGGARRIARSPYACSRPFGTAVHWTAPARRARGRVQTAGSAPDRSSGVSSLRFARWHSSVSQYTQFLKQLEQPKNAGAGDTGQRGQEAGSDPLTTKFAVHRVPSQIQETAACDREQRVQNMRAKIRRETQL